PEVFHDVDLAGVRPRVPAQHPEGGPHALAIGHLHSSLDPSVGEGLLALGLEACRRVLPAFASLPARLDDQVAAAVERRVRVAGRVVLELAVVPVGPGVVGPLAAIDGRAGGPFEIVPPDELPGRVRTLRRRRRSTGSGAGRPSAGSPAAAARPSAPPRNGAGAAAARCARGPSDAAGAAPSRRSPGTRGAAGAAAARCAAAATAGRGLAPRSAGAAAGPAAAGDTASRGLAPRAGDARP